MTTPIRPGLPEHGTVRQMTFGQATVEALSIAMRADERVIVLGEDIGWGGNFGQFRGLLKEFGPRRVIDMPISESIIMAVSVGAASTGMRPVASMSFVEFTMGAMDEIVNQAAKFRYMFGGQTSVPLVLRASDGVLRSSAAQHSESFEAIFAHIPGLKVVAPATAADAKGLLAAAIADDDPVVYLENKRVGWSRGEVPDGDYVVPLGKARVAREGHDVTVICYSIMVTHALEAAKVLAEQDGIDVEILDLRTLVPLDEVAIDASVAKTGHAVIAHEAWRFGGFGAELAAQISERHFGRLGGPVARVGARRSHMPFSPPLERAVAPQAEEITEAVRATLRHRASGADTRPGAGRA
jgi:pyruvate dehydrogenase E1 component beta subunit